MDALQSQTAAAGCDECDCALLADGAGRERDGCPWHDACEYGPGCGEPTGDYRFGLESVQGGGDDCGS